MRARNGGFAFFELAVVLLAVAALLGFVLPLGRRARAREARARTLHDLARLARDLAGAPLAEETPTLVGKGSLPAGLESRSTAPFPGGIAAPTADVWGQALVLRLSTGAGRPHLLLSAGPDGRLDTPEAAVRATGDDLGFPIRAR